MTYELVIIHNGEEIRRSSYDRELDLLIAKNKVEAAGYQTYTVLHSDDRPLSALDRFLIDCINDSVEGQE